MAQTLFLTGEPRVGKTTLLKNVLEEVSALFPANLVGGFYTGEVRENDQRRGFKLVTLDGKECAFSHADFTKSPIQLQGSQFSYGIDIECLETMGVGALKSALNPGGLLIIDEIGKMQLFSEAFQEIVLEALEHPVFMLGTIVKVSHPWADKLKEDKRVNIVELTENNRDKIKDQVVKSIQEFVDTSR